TALQFAQGRGLVAQNVARGVKIKSDDRQKGQLKKGQDFPSKAEIKLLIDKAPDRWRPFLVTAVFTGMRASELPGLRWAMPASGARSSECRRDSRSREVE